MKLKSLLLVGLAVGSLASSASADVFITLTGSTAFRAAVHNSVIAAMGGTAQYAYDAATLAGSTKVIFKGNIPGIVNGLNQPETVWVRTFWSGSATGIGTLANNTTVNVPATSVTVTSGGVQLPSSPAFATENVQAQFAFSDVFKESTAFSAANLTGESVGIVPFVFVASESAPSNLNVTAQLFRALVTNASLPLSMFTGNSGDSGTLVLPIGRDGGSGTRITALAETGYGINSLVQQFIDVTSGSTTTITSARIVPTSGSFTNVALDPVNAGNGGYSSGGALATALGKVSPSVNLLDASGSTIISGAPVAFIGYLGASDANTAIAAGAKLASYEGSTFNPGDIDPSPTAFAFDTAPITTGKYTFWGYERLYYRPTATAHELTFLSTLNAQLPNNLGNAGIDAALMSVVRSGEDGSLVGPL